VIEYLIAAGADTNAVDKVRTTTTIPPNTEICVSDVCGGTGCCRCGCYSHLLPPGRLGTSSCLV
jgi:hypothetical protein